MPNGVRTRIKGQKEAKACQSTIAVGRKADRRMMKTMKISEKCSVRPGIGPDGYSASSLLGAIVAVVLWVGSGVYIVDPAEQGVVLQFGRHVNTSSPGVNYHLPWPIQNVVIVDIGNVRRAEIGFRSVSGQEARRILEEALMLTADENIVEVGMLVQYRVKDAAAFVFNVNNPEAVLHTTTEVALRSAVGKMPIDGVITATPRRGPGKYARLFAGTNRRIRRGNPDHRRAVCRWRTRLIRCETRSTKWCARVRTANAR